MFPLIFFYCCSLFRFCVLYNFSGTCALMLFVSLCSLCPGRCRERGPHFPFELICSSHDVKGSRCKRPVFLFSALVQSSMVPIVLTTNLSCLPPPIYSSLTHHQENLVFNDHLTVLSNRAPSNCLCIVPCIVSYTCY